MSHQLGFLRRFMFLAFLLGSGILYAQSDDALNPKFLADWLNYPQHNIEELEAVFEMAQVGRYYEQNDESAQFLHTQYANYELDIPANFDDILRNQQILRIDLVFTAYPVRKEDWITNYNDLLANRLKALFELAPHWNSNEIIFRIVLQTNCKTEAEAKALPHGFQVVYQSNKVSGQELIQEKEMIAERKATIKSSESEEPIWSKEFTPIQEKRTEYPQPEFYPRKPIEPKKLDCPDFRQKRRWFSR